MTEPSDNVKAAIRALASGSMAREECEVLMGYIASEDARHAAALNAAEAEVKTKIEAYCRKLENWMPTNIHIGPLHTAGMLDAYADATKHLRVLMGLEPREKKL